jgi:hypothetical protein
MASAQLVDRTKAPNPAGAGINKSLSQQVGSGRGDVNTPDSSIYIIRRDPFRSIRRGRQLFQRKFALADGLGPNAGDGTGDPVSTKTIGAGLSDSCAACHGRPRGSAGFGGDVVTRPDSRDAPHLFGLGLKEMLADEMTADLRAIRAAALLEARQGARPVRRELATKGVRFGFLTAQANGAVDTTEVEGVDTDLRVRPFFAHGGTISIREFVVGAFQAEMGLQAADTDLAAAVAGRRVVTPSGMVLDGSLDTIEAPPASDPNSDPDRDGKTNEMPESLVDHMEFYLLNYFKAGTGERSERSERGRGGMDQFGCTSCHVANLVIQRDRRVADVETVFNPAAGVFNRLFATASALFVETPMASGPSVKSPALRPFVVNNIFTDFKRHDLGPNFWERNYDGSFQKQFLTTALWGVGSTGPYGHDGRSGSLHEVILRHGGEAQAARDRYAAAPRERQEELLEFLNTLILFPPDDTASNLDPANRGAADFPQSGHGSIRLTTLFNNPNDPE